MAGEHPEMVPVWVHSRGVTGALLPGHVIMSMVFLCSLQAPSDAWTSDPPQDPTGVMQAAMTAEAAEKHGDALRQGCALALRDVAAVRVSGSPQRFLCISLATVAGTFGPEGHGLHSALPDCTGDFGPVVSAALPMCRPEDSHLAANPVGRVHKRVQTSDMTPGGRYCRKRGGACTCCDVEELGCAWPPSQRVT